jgi:hypothetical protein
LHALAMMRHTFAMPGPHDTNPTSPETTDVDEARVADFGRCFDALPAAAQTTLDELAERDRVLGDDVDRAAVEVDREPTGAPQRTPRRPSAR